MAPARKRTKGEALWREAWEATPHSGTLELTEERLIIRCDAVSAEYGADPEILDDGRTVTFAAGDHVAFGVVAREGQAPVAVNVWRAPKKVKKRKARDLLEDEMVKDSGFDFSAGGAEGERRRRREPVPEALGGDLMGVVRNQSASSGNYWVDCEEAFNEYQKDICVLFHMMPRGIGVGDAISFQLEAPRNEHASPLAENIKKATGDAAEALLFKFKRKGKGKGKGKGKERPWADQRKALKASTMRMLGVVKKKSSNTGRHFVLCQDISDVYGVDAQIPVEEMPDDIQVGDRISFDACEPEEGATGTPLACNVRKVKATSRQKRPAKDEEDEDEDEEQDGADEEYADGEEEAGEAEPEEAGEAEDEAEEAVVGEEELAEAEAADRLEWGALDEEADGEEAEAALEKEVGAPAKPKQRNSRKPAVAEDPAVEDEPGVEDPESLDGWIKMQDVIFKGQKPLRKGWIRIRSKSRGLVYYYNTDTGESTSTAPLR